MAWNVQKITAESQPHFVFTLKAGINIGLFQFMEHCWPIHFLRTCLTARSNPSKSQNHWICRPHAILGLYLQTCVLILCMHTLQGSNGTRVFRHRPFSQQAFLHYIGLYLAPFQSSTHLLCYFPCIPTELPCQAEGQMWIFGERGRGVYGVIPTSPPPLYFPREWVPFSDKKNV